MTKYQLKMAEYYNQRVKLKWFNIGDLVLHYYCNKRPDTRQTRANLGRTVQSHPLFSLRKLPPRGSGRKQATSPLECGTSKEVLWTGIVTNCMHDLIFFNQINILFRDPCILVIFLFSQTVNTTQKQRPHPKKKK